MGLSEKGIKQCYLAGEQTHSFKFKEVHMSPMRRCIETAYYMFKDHPNFKEMVFKVNPLLRAKINMGADIPVFDSCEMIKHEYLPLFEREGVKFEFSEEAMSPDAKFPSRPWYFKSLDAGFQKRITGNWFDASEDEVGFR